MNYQVEFGSNINIKHEQQCFIMFPNNVKRVGNMIHSRELFDKLRPYYGLASIPAGK